MEVLNKIPLRQLPFANEAKPRYCWRAFWAMLWCHSKIWLYKGHNHPHQTVLSFYPSPWSVAQPDAQRTVSFLLFEALRQNCIFFLGSLQPDVRLFVNYLGSFFGIWEVHLRWCLHYWVPWGLHDDDRLLPLAAYTIDIIIHEFLKPMQISDHNQMKFVHAYMCGHIIGWVHVRHLSSLPVFFIHGWHPWIKGSSIIFFHGWHFYPWIKSCHLWMEFSCVGVKIGKK